MEPRESTSTSVAVAYARWLLRWRWAVLVAVVVGVAVASAGGRYIRIGGDYRVLFSEDNPQLLAFEELRDVYVSADDVLFAVEPDDGRIFSREALAAIEELTAEAWKLPFAVRVESLTNFQHLRADGDDIFINDLVSGGAGLSDQALAGLREVALGERSLVGRLLSPSADFAGVDVVVELPPNDPSALAEPTLAARELAERIEAAYPVRVHVSGLVPFNHAFADVQMNDMRTLVPVMYLLLVLSMALLLRSFAATLTIVLGIALSTAATMGIAGWFGFVVTPPSAAAPIMILTIAVADGIHVLLAALQRMRRGATKHDALVEALRVNMTAILLTSLTTTIGFLSLNFSKVPPLRDLGNIVGLGAVLAFVVSVSFLPALMAILPVRVGTRGEAPLERWLARLADFVVARHRPLFAAMAVLTLGLAALLPANKLDDNYLEFFDRSVPFRRATEIVNERLTGVYQLELSVAAGKSNGITDPAYLAILGEFEQWLLRQDEILHVATFAEVVRRLNRVLHGNDPAYYRPPETRELAAQYVLLYEMSLPYGRDLNSQIDLDRSATRVVAILKTVSSSGLRDIAERAEVWLRDNAPPAMHSRVASPTVMFAYISRHNTHGMIQGTLLAFLLISTTLGLALRSFKIALVSLVPNLVPTVMAFGLWGIAVGQVGTAVSGVIAMTLGIVVDDTVHFLTRYQRLRREDGLDAGQAVDATLRSVGTALAVTSAVLICGFSVLTFSGFQMTNHMGLVSAMTIAFALLADFVLLPALLIRFNV